MKPHERPCYIIMRQSIQAVPIPISPAQPTPGINIFVNKKANNYPWWGQASRCRSRPVSTVAWHQIFQMTQNWGKCHFREWKSKTFAEEQASGLPLISLRLCKPVKFFPGSAPAKAFKFLTVRQKKRKQMPHPELILLTYTCQLSRLRRESHACQSKMLISCQLTLTDSHAWLKNFSFLTTLTDTLSEKYNV